MPEQSDRPENPQTEKPSMNWIAGLALFGLGQYLGSRNDFYNAMWLLLTPFGLVLALGGLIDYIRWTRLQPGKSRQFKVIGLSLAGCGLLIGLYQSFLPKRFSFDASPFVSALWGFGFALMLIGLMVWEAARTGGANRPMRFQRWGIPILLTIGALWYLVAIPNFLAAQKRNWQADARTNLGGIYVAEMDFYKKHGRYGNFDEIGFRPAGTNDRYTYRIDASGRPGAMIPASIGETPDNTIVQGGISPNGQAFTATATAHLDNDDTIDQWHVNDIKQNLQYPDTNDVHR